MNDKVFKRFKQEYEKLNHYREMANELKNTKETLEEQPVVRRYLEVCQKLDDKMLACGCWDDRCIIETARKKITGDETNEIYVCIGTYKESKNVDFNYWPYSIPVPHDSEEAEYSEYVDLEKEITDVFKIHISDRDEFEKKHDVIYLEKGPLSRQYFEELQVSFFLDAFKNGQKKAINSVKKKTKKYMK